MFYSEPVAVRVIDLATTSTSYSDSTSETEIASLDLASLTLSADGAIRLSAEGTLDARSTGNVTFRVKLATVASTETIMQTSGITLSTSTALRNWELQTVTVGKGPADQYSWGYIDITSPLSAGVTVAPSTFSGVGTDTSALDEEQAISISVTAQMSVASTGLGATRTIALLEALS